MLDRKGVANSTYALLTSTALITGLMLLSFSGNPYSLANSPLPQNPNEDFNPDTGNISLPENSSVNASNYINPENINRSASQNQDFVTKIAKGLFKFISGQDLQPSENRTTENGTTSDNIGNQTNQTLEGNQSRNENITAPKESGDQTTSPENLTVGGNNSEDDFSNISENQSFNGSEDFNSSLPENSTEKEGLLAGLVKTISNLFGSDSQPSMNQSDTNQSQTPEQNQTGETPDRNDTTESSQNNTETPPQQSQDPESEENSSQQSNEPESSSQQKLPDTNTLLMLLAGIGLLAVVVLFYRSDRNGKEFLKALFERIKSGVTSIPDLFRRSIVNTISFITSKIVTLLRFGKRAAKAPAKTATRIKEAAVAKINGFKAWFDRTRSRSAKQNISLLLKGEEESYEGLEQIWHDLKKRLNLENDRTVTPAEVRAEAIRQNLPDGTVNEIVEAFRKEKYSSEGYPEELDVSKWDRDLQGDEQ